MTSPRPGDPGLPSRRVAQPEGLPCPRAAGLRFPYVVLTGRPTWSARDEAAAGAGGRNYSCVRASHADREQVIDVLKAAFVQGRLAKDELDLRLGRVLASRTYADLSALTADLPVRLTRAEPPEPVRQLATGQQPPASQAPAIQAPGSPASRHRAARQRARPGIGRAKDSQGVGLRDRAPAEPGGRCGAAELGNRHCHDRGRRSLVRLRGGRPGHRADDVALMARETLRQPGG